MRRAWLLDWRLGSDHPAVVQARAQLQAGQFLDALLTVRAALR